MNYSNRAGLGSLPTRRAPLPPRRADDAKPAPIQRATPLMRRYEIACIAASGADIRIERIAPAIPFFETAFSAFARGTLIATPDGNTAIEDLEPGMMVLDENGRSDTISWIGSMTLYPPKEPPAPEGAGLTRFTSDALGMGRPMPDLILGPGARILHRDARCRELVGNDRALVPARSLADGSGIVALSPLMPVSVYHLMCAGGHRVLRANGVEVESFHPGTGLDTMIEPELLTLFMALFPNIDRERGFGLMALPRLTRSEAESLLG